MIVKQPSFAHHTEYIGALAGYLAKRQSREPRLIAPADVIGALIAGVGVDVHHNDIVVLIRPGTRHGHESSDL